eukprot:scaffold100627_cov75-Phaeocystis_antarctica.AAC.2
MLRVVCVWGAEQRRSVPGEGGCPRTYDRPCLPTVSRSVHRREWGLGFLGRRDPRHPSLAMQLFAAATLPRTMRSPRSARKK